jgi:predicted dehydrogenase
MPLDVAFLGYRFMGRAHANALARLPMFFPEAPATTREVLVGRDEAALREAADRLGFDRIATDWRAVVDEVDVLVNLGPNFLHEEPSIAALDAGVHVLCEKPLAPTVEAAERMAAAAAESDAVAATGFNYRYVPAIRYARGLIESGELGDIRQFRGRYLQDWLVDPDEPWSWRLDEELAGSGALGDLGAHTVDLARFLVGDVARASGHLRTFVDERPVEEDDGDGEGAADGPGDAHGGTQGTRTVTVDDAFAAVIAFEGGAMGTVEASRVAPGHENDQVIEVHGTDGSLRFSLERLNELEVLRPGSRGYETVLVTEASDPYVEAWWPPGHVLGWEHTFVHEHYEFLTAVEGAASGSGGPPEREDDGTDGRRYRPDFQDGLAVQRVLDAVQRSDERGEQVGVD